MCLLDDAPFAVRGEPEPAGPAEADPGRAVGVPHEGQNCISGCSPRLLPHLKQNTMALV